MSQTKPAPTPSLGKKAVRGSLYTLISDYLVYGINFVRGIILARLLNPELFGIMGLATFFQGLFTNLKNLGFDQAVIHQKQPAPESYNAHLILNTLSTLISLITLFLISPLLYQHYDAIVVRTVFILMIGQVFQSLSSTPSIFLRKNFAFGKLSFIQLAGTLISFFIAVVLAWKGFGLWALIAVPLVLELSKFLFKWIISPWKPSLKLTRLATRTVLIFGTTVWLGNLLNFLMLQFDDFLVGTLVSYTILGYYSKAYSLAKQPLGLFSQMLTKVMGPVISELKDNQQKLTYTFNLMMGLTFRGTILVGLILFLWAPQFILLLIGEKWLPMVPLFRGLILYLVAEPIWEITRHFLIFLGKPKLYVRGQALQAVLILTLGTVSVHQFGALGAAVCVSFILVTTTFFLLIKHVNQEIALDWTQNLVIPSSAILLTGIMSWLTFQKINPQGIMQWLYICLFPSITYLTILFIAQGKKLMNDLRFIYGQMKK